MASDHLKTRRFWARAAASLAFRVACYDAMAFMALWAEARPAPTLPDPLVAWVPYVEVAARYIYLLWIAAYVPVAHVLVVTTVVLAHLHYTIDVIGAYAVTFSIFVLREGDAKALLSRF